MAVCRLTLLGGFSLETADGVKLALPTRKDRLLLAYLALSPGRPQSRERLAGLLWGDRGEAQARDSLKQSLAGIRQARLTYVWGAAHVPDWDQPDRVARVIGAFMEQGEGFLVRRPA